MRYILVVLCVVLSFGLLGCVKQKSDSAIPIKYRQINVQEAKEIMDSTDDYVLLDVRTVQEYDEGHIAGAVLIPYDEIPQKADVVLPQKDRLILIYCRSGRRSKIAAQSLVDMGYTNIVEFGGINDWPYEIVS
ncbi:MAG: rhodanese-like domain-containing protein [Clostridia bacterium]|nr:rhodanese-like domain-containing protein [Clostridia bacterium]